MLEELDIRNFALIDNAHIDFNKGFTVLSGETGAGKSILIGSLAFLLGGKAALEQIRTGQHEASVSGTFLLECQEAFDWLSERGIDPDENRVLLRRVVKDTGKSSAWICGVPVTRNDLVDFAQYIADIHGQHEQQSLMKVASHRRYLDIYAGITEQVRDFTESYSQLVEKRRLLDSMNTNETERQNRIEMLEFAVQEITDAKLKPNEDVELEAEECRLSSFEKLYADIEEITQVMDGEGGENILSLLKRLVSVSRHSATMDSTLEPLDSRLNSAFYEIEDLAQEFSSYKNHLTFDPQRLQQVQERLDIIYRLKKKYCQNPSAQLDDILAYLDKAQQELEQLTSSSMDKSQLEKQIQELEKTVYAKAVDISQKRQQNADKMSSEIMSVLSKLGMANAKFCVSLSKKEGTQLIQKCNPYGMDEIEFLISPNAGSQFHPLTKIASGGELSRVMLAMKTILSHGDTVSTLVFDEIDTGIGGEVAVALGEHMKMLSKSKQILCITHLASIAVFASSQIKIRKSDADGLTSTNVYEIQGQERVAEIARMLSGDASSQASLDHARELLEKCGGI